MLTLKQAFSTAATLQSSKTQVQLCEACPMHDLHKLCERIEGRLPPWTATSVCVYRTMVSRLSGAIVSFSPVFDLWSPDSLTQLTISL